jgi:hypothetical protein
LVRAAALLASGFSLQETLAKIRLFIRSLQWVEEAVEVTSRTDWLAAVEAVVVDMPLQASTAEAPARSVKET